jgi:hypothetical protein
MIQIYPAPQSRKHIAGICLAAAVLLGARPALADAPKPEPAALTQLQNEVSNLGYTTTLADDKQSFSIPWSGSGNYSFKIHFDLSGDASLGYLYIDIEDLTPAQLAKLNYIKLLEKNDVGNFYFSMENISTGETLYANAVIPVTGFTPQTLRTTLQGVSDKLNDTAQYWDTSLWK